MIGVSVGLTRLVIREQHFLERRRSRRLSAIVGESSVSAYNRSSSSCQASKSEDRSSARCSLSKCNCRVEIREAVCSSAAAVPCRTSLWFAPNGGSETRWSASLSYQTMRGAKVSTFLRGRRHSAPWLRSGHACSPPAQIIPPVPDDRRSRRVPVREGKLPGNSSPWPEGLRYSHVSSPTVAPGTPGPRQESNPADKHDVMLASPMLRMTHKGRYGIYQQLYLVHMALCSWAAFESLYVIRRYT
jgi:hypothetical protein